MKTWSGRFVALSLVAFLMVSMSALSAFAAGNVPEVISVNFYDPDSLSGVVSDGNTPLSGLSEHDEVLEKDWINVCTRSNEVEYVDDAPVRKPLSLGPTGSKLYWSVPSFYHWNEVDVFRRGYVASDWNADEPQFTVTDIPYEYYELILYYNSDQDQNPETKASDDFGFRYRAPKVNGVCYTWDAGRGTTVIGEGHWGHTKETVTAFGVNALRISGLSGSELNFTTQKTATEWYASGNYYYVFGNVAAFQIVELKPIEVSGLITSKEISNLAKGAPDVYLKAAPGSTIRIFDRAMDCGIVHVISSGSVLVETFDNLPPSEGSFVQANIDKFDVSGVSGGCLVHTWKAPARTLSVNFGASTANGSYMPSNWGFYGALGPEELPAISWNNIDFDDGTAKTVSDFRPLLWDGVTGQTNVCEGLSMSWNVGANWRGGDTSKQDPFRGGFCAPNGGSWKVDISGIPFEAYDLILYFSYDGGGAIDAVPVNETFYRYDANLGATVECEASADSWGSADLSCMSELGKNALMITNLTGQAVSLRRQSEHWHQPLCALQLIERRPPLKKRLFGMMVIFR